MGETGVIGRRSFGGAIAAIATGVARADDGPSVRLASLDLVLTETLISLCRPPLANANNPLYRRLIGHPVLPGSVQDLGPAQEPNLELLRMIAPDTVLVSEWQASIVQIVGSAAPVRLVRTLKPGRPVLEALREVVDGTAAVAGGAEEARRLLQGLGTAVATARGTFGARSARQVYLCRFVEDGRHVAVFGPNSMVGGILKEVGLRNAWTRPQNVIGTVLVPIEELAGAPDAAVIHFDRGEETERAMRRLAANPLWSMLPFSRTGRVIAMPVIHPNGGAASARRFAEQLVRFGAAGIVDG